ncbi:NAD-glutamate dehydrogenase, partial [Leclercia adecarboxylata]|nr:NAD-glutamate dehydrogenase [Leclercia adecarboxylata]
FVQRLNEATGMSAANVAGAYVIVRDIFHLPHWFRQIEALDHKVPAELQLALMDELMRLGRRATRWFLRNRRSELAAARYVAPFGPLLAALVLKLDELLQCSPRARCPVRYPRYPAASLPELLAPLVPCSLHLYPLLPFLSSPDVTL